MKANVISIGNSRGIRIPKAVLNQVHIEDEVELDVDKDRIVIKPVKARPREEWDKAFKLMHERKEDALLIADKTEIEMDGWEWK